MKKTILTSSTLASFLYSASVFAQETASPASSEAVGVFTTTMILVLLVFVLMYFVPTAVAQYRKSSNFTTVLLVNIFLGWTALGWVVALILAFAGDSGTQAQRHREMMDALNKKGQ